MLTEIRQFRHWLRRRSPDTTTHIHYISDLNLFFNWCGKAVTEVTAADVDRWIDASHTAGHASATINRRLAALTALYRYLAMMHDDAPACPVIARRHYLRRGRRLPRDVEDDIIERLFAVIDSSRDRAMFLLMLRCGLRVGEIQALTLDDLFLKPRAGQLPRLWLRGKGGYERVAYLSAQAVAAVQAWVEDRPKTTTPTLFLNRFNEPLTVTGIQWRLRFHCRKAGIWLTCHQLRHTFARHLIEAGVPITTIQRLLGHNRIRSTETYLHISDQQVQRDYQAAIATLTDRWLGGA